MTDLNQAEKKSKSVSITNLAPNQGAQGIFNAPVNIYQFVDFRSQPTDPKFLAKAKKKLRALPESEIRDIAPLPPCSKMHIRCNPMFVGRTDYITTLARTIKVGDVGVIGMGGLGKTQLVSEFVHRYSQYFGGGIFWLNFADANTIPSEIAACGDSAHLNLRPDFNSLSLDEQTKLVLAVWQSPLPRLLVFDNCEDEQLLMKWRPITGGSRTIFTSRRAIWDETHNIHLIRLDVLSRNSSTKMLRKYHADLSNTHDEILNKIAERLGDLPLALHLAGSFLRTYHHTSFGTPESYIESMDQTNILDHPSLIGEGSKISPTYHGQNIAKTFAISYRQLNPDDSMDQYAVALLKRVGYFAPGEIIPREIVKGTTGQTNSLDISELEIEKAIARPLQLGFMDEVSDGSLRMHHLVSEFIRSLPNNIEAKHSVEDALISCFRDFGGTGNTIDACKLEPHLRDVTDNELRLRTEKAVSLSNILGNHLRSVTNHTEAIKYLEMSLEVHEELLTRNHTKTGVSLNDLGNAFYFHGDYKKAHHFLKRAAVLFKKSSDYSNLGAALDNLGQVSSALGDTTGAKQYHERALDIRRKFLGHDHISTTISLHNLGSLLHRIGDFDAAFRIHKEALEIRERISEAPNLHIAASLHSLAQLLCYKRDFKEALDYCQRANKIRENLLGPFHPYTLNVIIMLVFINNQLGNLEEVNQYAKRLSEVAEKSTALSAAMLNNIGYDFWLEGQDQKALENYNEALEIYERTRGKLHPDLAITLNNIGMALMRLREYPKAHQYLNRACKIQAQSNGGDNELTARILNNFGVLHRLQGNLSAAKKKLENAWAMRRNLFGECHQDTATTRNNLGVLFQAEGNYEKAQEYIKDGLEMRKKLLGEKHADFASSLNDLGMLLYIRGDLIGGRICLKKALAIRKRMLSKNHPDTAETLYNLSILAETQGEKKYARTLLERATAIYKLYFGENHPDFQIKSMP